MSCNWGTELWDQFDNLEKHTSCGIDFLERYSKFLRERADIELSYAKQIRSLSKKYHPKRSREDESRYSWCLAFAATLRQLNELSVQREEFAENLNTQIVCELTRYTQEVKTERKNHFQDGRRAQQHIEGSWKQLESSKRRFERDCKEAERAQQVSDRIDLDNKTDGEKRCSLKARQTAQQKKQAAEESRKDYVTSLNQFNQDQHQHYHTLVPVIYQRIQDMEERRIERVCEAMRSSAEAERKVLPAAGRSLEVMMEAAEGIQPRTYTQRLEEVKLSLQRLEEELRKHQAWFSEADSRLSENGSRRQSGGCGSNSQVTTPGSSSLKQLDNRSPASRESPDGSYTEDNSAELHFKSRSSEFDDDFDDEEPLPSIGTCKSLYPFQGQNEGTLSMVEGELLSVVEEDKGDGWTRVRRNLEEEGYVPTSYIKVFLESSAKGAMTYI
ncbi:hypothetical protein KUCAC02_031426 [Chaenocephalus aceratus]|nr:hypothetical protein KUCAC02_031426 [Chaenocephalus aceratus]